MQRLHFCVVVNQRHRRCRDTESRLPHLGQCEYGAIVTLYRLHQSHQLGTIIESLRNAPRRNLTGIIVENPCTPNTAASQMAKVGRN